MHKCIKCQHNYFTKDSCMHELRDAINLEWFSQVPSSLFPANLRELALILSKNSDSKIESNLSKRNRKQDPSLWVRMMTTDTPSLVSFLEMFCHRRTVMLDPHHGRDPACPQSSLLSRLISHMISKLPRSWGITRQRLLSNCFSWKCNQFHFIFPLLPRLPTFTNFRV